jgi:hypothetical protein
MIREIYPEFNEDNTIACTTFLDEKREDFYTISTCRLSGAHE